jgi:hypothetical protein
LNFTCTVQSFGCNSSCVTGSLNVISNAITCSSTKSTSHDNKTSCTASNFSSITGSIVNSVPLANNHVCAYTSTLTHSYSHVQYISLLSNFSSSVLLSHIQKKSFIVSINHDSFHVHASSLIPSSRFFSHHVNCSISQLDISVSIHDCTPVCTSGSTTILLSHPIPSSTVSHGS